MDYYQAIKINLMENFQKKPKWLIMLQSLVDISRIYIMTKNGQNTYFFFFFASLTLLIVVRYTVHKIHPPVHF